MHLLGMESRDRKRRRPIEMFCDDSCMLPTPNSNAAASQRHVLEKILLIVALMCSLPNSDSSVSHREMEPAFIWEQNCSAYHAVTPCHAKMLLSPLEALPTMMCTQNWSKIRSSCGWTFLLPNGAALFSPTNEHVQGVVQVLTQLD